MIFQRKKSQSGRTPAIEYALRSSNRGANVLDHLGERVLAGLALVVREAAPRGVDAEEAVGDVLAVHRGHSVAAASPRSGSQRPGRAWLGWPCAFRTGLGQLKRLPGEPGVYLFRDDARRGRSTSARRSRCGRACASTSRPGAATPQARIAARRAHRRRRDDRHRQRGRGAAPRAEPRQAPPAAVQRAAARRQVVPVHRGHGRGRLPARHVHARAPPARRRLLRAVREREEGARDARRAQQRLPLPALRGAEAGAAQRHPVPRLPHRALLRAVRRLHLEGGLPAHHRGRDRVSLGRRPADQARARAADARRRGRASASRTRRATATGCSRCEQLAERQAVERRVDRDDRRDRRRRRGDRAAVQVFPLRDGKLVDRYSFHLENATGRSRPRCWRRSASSTTARRRRCRRRWSCRAEAGDTAALEAFLSERRGSRVEVRAPERGEKRRLQELAEQNAELALSSETFAPSRSGCAASRRSRSCARRSTWRRCRSGSSASTSRTSRARRSSARWSSSRTRCRRRRTTASSACERLGRPGRLRGDGRGRLAPVRPARATRRPSEYDESFAATPNLVVIDGGKGQLSAALAAMQALRPAARRGDRAREARGGGVPARPAGPGRARPPLAGAAAAAAASATRRTASRSASTASGATPRARESMFDPLEGVGPVRRRALVQHFGSAERFLAASAGGARGVPGCRRRRRARSTRSCTRRAAAGHPPGGASGRSPKGGRMYARSDQAPRHADRAIQAVRENVIRATWTATRASSASPTASGVHDVHALGDTHSAGERVRFEAAIWRRPRLGTPSARASRPDRVPRLGELVPSRRRRSTRQSSVRAHQEERDEAERRFTTRIVSFTPTLSDEQPSATRRRRGRRRAAPARCRCRRADRQQRGQALRDLGHQCVVHVGVDVEGAQEPEGRRDPGVQSTVCQRATRRR